MLTLGGHGLLWSAVAMLRAATQAVGHAVHLLERLEPEEEEDEGRVSEIINDQFLLFPASVHRVTDERLHQFHRL